MVGLRAIVNGAARRDRSLRFIRSDGKTSDTCPWSALVVGGMRRGSRFIEQGVGVGDTVILIDDTGPALVEALIGVNHAGAIPVVLAPPLPSRGRAQMEMVARVAAQASVRAIAVGEDLANYYRQEGGPWTDSMWSLPSEAADEGLLAARPEHESALLQFSSGSTREPRGVVVPQRCLASNLAQIADGAGRIHDDDVVVSWLPLYHDMGLIAGLFGPAAWGVDGVLMDPMTFIRRPVRWLRAMSEHGGSISMSPNFGFEYCMRFVRDRELEGLRLDRWRIAWNGAEMVLASTLDRFERRFAAYGLAPNTVVPCYGAAEGTLKITSARPATPRTVRRLSRAHLSDRMAVDAVNGEPHVEIVGVGRPSGLTSVRIVDEDGGPVPDETIGEIEVRGPSVSPGYHPTSDPALDGQRFISGDLGFMCDGELFVTGRKRDLIVVDGRNIYPFDVEWSVGQVLGRSLRRAAAFAAPDSETGSERVVVALELAGRRRLSPSARAEVEAAVIDAAGTSRVTIVEVDRLPTTSSGKIKRGRARQAHLEATQPAA